MIRSSPTPAYIYYGRIIDVDSVRRTLTVRAEVAEKTFHNVSYATPYLHPFDGEGMDALPEPGAVVLVCVASDPDARAVVLAYVPFVDHDGTTRSNRPPATGGDLSFTTRDRNGIKIRRGGTVEAYSTPLSRIMLLPRNNQVLVLAENWDLETFGGSFRWESFRPEEDPDGRKGTQLTFEFKEFADDKGPVAKFQAGAQIEDSDDAVAKLSVFSSGNTNDEVSAVALNKSGEIRTHSGDIHHKLKSGSSIAVYDTIPTNAKGVILGPDFLTDLLTMLTGIQAALLGLGIPIPGMPEMITKITASLVPPAGGPPYLSTRTKTE